MEIKNNISLSEKQLKFWKELSEFCKKNNLNFILDIPEERTFFDLKIYSKYYVRLFIDSIKKELYTGFYIEDNKALYFYLLENKKEIESLLNFSLFWQNLETEKLSFIYSKINFDIDNTLEWNNYLYVILDKSESIIKVFKNFVAKYNQEYISETELKEESNLKLEISKDGIIRRILKKLFSFFYKKDYIKLEENIEKKEFDRSNIISETENTEDLKEHKSIDKLSINSSKKTESTEKLEILKETELKDNKVTAFESNSLTPEETVTLDIEENIIKLEKTMSLEAYGEIKEKKIKLGENIIKEKEAVEPKKTAKREPRSLIKRKISEDLLVQKILSEEEMRNYGERLGISLSCGNLKPIFSPGIVIFLVSVAYYEGFSGGGYWNKVFNILKIKYTQVIYTFLIETLRETLYHKHLFIDNSTQWAYNTIMAHTIVPLEGGAFYKYLDFAYSFYDSIDSNLISVSDEELKLMVKELLEREKDSPFILKGTRLAIENCLNIVVEYFLEILYYIDILDSQKEDISDLGEVIKEKIKEWYDFNLSKGFSIKKSESISSSEDSKEEIISITNKIGNLKFTCDKDGVNVEIPKMLFDYSIDDIFIKVGEQKNILNYKKIENKFIVKPRIFTSKTFDFKLIKLFINGELVKEWGNKIIFFKENGKNIKPKEKNGNIYELDIRKVRILFESSYSIFSSTTKNKEISEVNITKSIKYADLNLEDEIYYLKKNNEIIIIKSLLKEEEPEIIIENNMIIKSILIEEKPVFNKHPEIFIPYTLPEKYKVFINDEPLEVKEGFNKIDLKEAGYYDIKICKGIKSTRETRVVRKEKQYFYFEDLNIVFYNEDGDKEYLFSHKEKKPVGNYNFDTTGISKVLYGGEEMEKCGNTFDIYIDNGFNKNFEFQMITDEGKEYNATGKMRLLEWSLDGKNYFSEYNKNLLYEDIKDKVLTVKIDNLVGDVVFYGNSWEEIGKNKIEFKYVQEELERRAKDIGIKAVFRLSSDIFSKACIESLFKIRFNSKVKNISYDKESGLLDIKVRGKINNMVLRIKDSNAEIIYEKENLDLDNRLAVNLKGVYRVEISLEEESFDFFAEEKNIVILYDDFLEF